jgi:hypothetical protein
MGARAFHSLRNHAGWCACAAPEDEGQEMNAIARITGPHPSHGGVIYLAEIWDAFGSPIIDEEYATAQEAHDHVESIMPGVETWWHLLADDWRPAEI